MSALSALDLTYRVKGATLVEGASFALEAGALTALIGPNGAGKTSLLQLALGLLAPTSGRAMLDGIPIDTLPPRERARAIAYLPQHRPLVWPQPVRDIVALGRFAHGGAPFRLAAADQTAVDDAITACRLEGLEERAADTLSGGELARLHLARALAAEAPVLVADEPVAALDPRQQHQTMQLFCELARKGRTVLTVIHDLELAARYADRVLWMHEGKIVAQGTPRETFTPERIRAVFDLEAQPYLRGPVLHLGIAGPA